MLFSRGQGGGDTEAREGGIGGKGREGVVRGGGGVGRREHGACDAEIRRTDDRVEVRGWVNFDGPSGGRALFYNTHTQLLSTSVVWAVQGL